MVGGETLEHSWGLLKKGGTLITIAAQSEGAKHPAVRDAFVIVAPSRAQLSEIARLIDAGQIRPMDGGRGIPARPGAPGVRTQWPLAARSCCVCSVEWVRGRSARIEMAERWPVQPLQPTPTRFATWRGLWPPSQIDLQTGGGNMSMEVFADHPEHELISKRLFQTQDSILG